MSFSGQHSLATRNKWFNIFFFIMLFGVILRILKAYLILDIDQDEALIYQDVMSHSMKEILFMRNFEYSGYPPFGLLIFKFWSYFADSELTFRIPSLIASMGSVLLFFRISRQLFRNDLILQYTSLFYFCTSSFFIYFGVIYRGYTFAIFLTLLTGLLFIKIRDEESSGTAIPRHHYIIFILLTFLSVLTDYSSIWAFVSLGCFMILAGQWKTISFRCLVAGNILTLPFAIYYLSFNLHETLAEKARSLPELTGPFNFFRISAFFYDLRFLMLKDARFSYLVLAILILGLYGLWLYRKKDRGVAGFLSLSIVIPVLIVAIFTKSISPIYDYKNLWFSHFALALSFLIFIYVSKFRRVGLVLFGLLQIAIIPIHLTNYRNEERLIRSSVVKDAFNYLHAEESGRAAVLVIPNRSEASATALVYKKWGGFNDISVAYNEFAKIEFLRSRKIYFFDLSERPDLSLIQKTAESAGCRVVNISDRIRQGYFAQCVSLQ